MPGAPPRQPPQIAVPEGAPPRSLRVAILANPDFTVSNRDRGRRPDGRSWRYGAPPARNANLDRVRSQ